MWHCYCTQLYILHVNNFLPWFKLMSEEEGILSQQQNGDSGYYHGKQRMWQ